MRGLVLQRVVVLVAAALAVAWLGVRYVDARAIGRVNAVLGDASADPARLESALADAHGADTLDPGGGTEALSYVAAIEIRLKRPQEALATLEEIVRREPYAAEPWLLIAQLTRTTDPARSAEARAQLRRLDPPVARESRR